MHKVSLKISSKGSNAESEKGRAFFLYTAHCFNLIHIAISFIKIWLFSYGVHKDSMEKKIKSKGSNYESKKGRAIIFKTTYFLGLKHIAMKVHSEIPYGY